MTIRSEDVNRIAGGGGEVRTSSGDKVGNVGQVYVDDETGEPSWVTVKTGLFGTQESFVPLSSADLAGDDVVVPYDKETIKGAPRMDADTALSPQQEKQLYSYYFSASPIGADADRDQDQPDRSPSSDEGLGDQAGTPRLRKYVVTEKVVQVDREEVPVEDSDRT